MLTQKEIILVAKAAGFPVTGQTLRNYIRAGLVHGADGVEGGIPGKGITTRYPGQTATEAIVAKDMLTKNKRKLTTEELALARKLAIACMTDKTFNPLNKEALSRFISDSEFSIESPSSIHVLDNTIVNGKTRLRIWMLLSIAAEWLLKMCTVNIAMLSVTMYEIANGAKLEVEQCDLVEVASNTRYVAKAGSQGYMFNISPDYEAKAVIDIDSSQLVYNNTISMELGY